MADWPSVAAFARDVGARPGTAIMWKERGIPVDFWPNVIAAARARGFGYVNADLLLRLRTSTRKHPTKLRHEDGQPAKQLTNTSQSVREQAHGGAL